MNVIEIEGLRKEYRSRRGRTVAVDGLDLVIESGGVFGFLGPNGSGKTTTMRCLLGLARPTAGRCRILGKDSGTELSEVITRVGSIIEGPALFPSFSARRNLSLLARLDGLTAADVDRVLEQVALKERERDLVKNYSLGMRQRLAIAAALLKDPEVLILDEPANGLDPAGIREVRQLLRRLGDEGRTVFVSSHILAEVQQTCDFVAILAKGRCVASGPVSDVLSNGFSRAVSVSFDDPEQLAAAAPALIAVGYAVTSGDDHLRIDAAPEEGSRIARTLADEGLYPRELRPETVDLETVFLELTSTEEVAA
ncbi:MAG: ABC transporter ATP-binding protein [Actinomycetota bacterium]